MKLDKPIDIQVYYMNEKTYKFFRVTDITNDKGLIQLTHGMAKPEIAIVVERNVTQILEI